MIWTARFTKLASAALAAFSMTFNDIEVMMIAPPRVQDARASNAGRGWQWDMQLWCGSRLAVGQRSQC
eukprot:1831496-Amphidinium_carterae.1